MSDLSSRDSADRPAPARPSPVEADQILKVTIEKIGMKGDGIARIGGFVIFVPDTKIGDVVEVQVLRVKNTCAFAEKVP